MLRADLEAKIQPIYNREMTLDEGRKINPATIQLIIDTIMQLMKSCKPQTISNMAKNRPLVARLMISRHFSDKTLSRKDVIELTSTIQELGAAATLLEIKDLQTNGVI